MYPTITVRLKSSEQRFFKTVLTPKLWFCHFCPKNLRMTGRSIQFDAKAVLMNTQTILILLFSLQTWKKQIKIYAFYLYETKQLTGNARVFDDIQ